MQVPKFLHTPFSGLLWMGLVGIGILPLAGQVTVRLRTLPSTTPPAATFFLAGNFNNWNPADPAFQLQRTNDGQQVVFQPPLGLLEFKITRGSWSTVEGDAQGRAIPNRQVNYQGQPLMLDLMIQNWEDLRQPAFSSTASEHVKIIDPEFPIPQLGRKRRIWVYLPPGYANSTQRYPVLYMQDGQNLFDTATSFAGEWFVDETMTRISREMRQDAIIVGIDNGSALRMNEYSPWKHPTMGGGEGEAYARFLLETLKPYIDQHFRTLTGPAHTGIMGSSMGGLIAFYVAMAYPQVFGRAGVFSPSFWFAEEVFTFAQRQAPRAKGLKLYLLAGEQEPPQMSANLKRMAALLTANGFSKRRLHTKVTGGAHNEAFWAREFQEAFLWLF